MYAQDREVAMLCAVWGFAAVAVLMVSYYLAVEERTDK